MRDADILGLIDNALADVGKDAMRWSPDAPRMETGLERDPISEILRAFAEMGRALAGLVPDPRRAPRVDRGWRRGHAAIPFVGGPFHRDIRNVPLPLLETLCVVVPEAARLDLRNLSPIAPMPATYTLRGVCAETPAWGHERSFGVYVAGPSDPDPEVLMEALEFAIGQGWRSPGIFRSDR